MTKNAYKHHFEAGEPRSPILFLFHGTGGDENQLLELKEVIPGAAVIAPRGDVLEHGSARFFRRTAEGIYDMDDLARATDTMTGFVAAHVEDANASSIVGLGYSNGANILASIIFARPDLFNAAVLMHPLIPFVPRIEGTLSHTRILMTAGRNDPICPPEMTERLETYLNAAGGIPQLEWHDGGHELRPSEIEAATNFLADRTATKPRGSNS